MKLWVSLFTIVLLLSFVCSNCSSPAGEKNFTDEKELVVFHAGSLSVPLKKISDAFEQENPGIKILLEPAGSRECARKITDLRRSCDVFASADYKVIDELLIPGHAKWNIKFASNEMAIVFNEDSRYSDEINSKNWFDILLRNDVIFARSNPDSDPCGYRAVLCIKLAERYYGKAGLAEMFLEKNLNYIRPKEVDLIGLLESKAIDYIFLYRSVAIQHNLMFLALPDSINMKKPELDSLYSTVSLQISGSNPGKTIMQKGEAMVYGVTIPLNAKEYDIALEFISFMLNPDKGMKIIEESGQPSVVPAVSFTFSEIPEPLRKYALKPKI